MVIEMNSILEIIVWTFVLLGIGFLTGFIFSYYCTMKDVCRTICDYNDMNYDSFSYNNLEGTYTCHCKGVKKDIPIKDIVIGVEKK